MSFSLTECKCGSEFKAGKELKPGLIKSRSECRSWCSIELYINEENKKRYFCWNCRSSDSSFLNLGLPELLDQFFHVFVAFQFWRLQEFFSHWIVAEPKIYIEERINKWIKKCVFSPFNDVIWIICFNLEMIILLLILSSLML